MKYEIKEEDRVHLGRFLGLDSCVWLPCAYGIAAALALFAVLALPGIVRPRAVLEVAAQFDGAAVRVDDVTRGTTPARIVLKPGNYTVTLASPGFEEISAPVTVKGRVFAASFAPRVTKYRAELKESEPRAAFLEGARAFAAWSFAGEPTPATQTPPALSEAAYRDDAARDTAALDAKFEILAAAFRFSATKCALADESRAAFLSVSGGAPPSPLAFLKTAARVAVFLREEPTAVVAAGDLLEGGAAETLMNSPWYRATVEPLFSAAPNAPPPQDRPPNRPAPTFRAIAGLDFAHYNGTNFVVSGTYPYETSVGEYAIAREQVTPAMWKAFLAAEPEWNAENTARLAEDGLVTDAYLDTATLPADFPYQAGVSAFAAEAWCDWFTEKLPPPYQGAWEARLPTEAEWEQAVGAIRTGEVWDWCADGYAPVNYVAVNNPYNDEIAASMRSLRGSSWAQTDKTLSAAARGSLAPASCSSFVGFRPVIARIKK